MKNRKNEKRKQVYQYNTMSVSNIFGLDANVYTITYPNQPNIDLDEELISISGFMHTCRNEQVIPISEQEIRYPQLQMIMKYMNLCKQYNQCKDVSIIKQPLCSTNILDVGQDGLPTEIIQYALDLYQSHGILNVYELINVCNYLSINGFMRLLCALVASLIKDKPMSSVTTILSPL